MGVAAMRTDAVLAASMASLNLSSKRLKEIEERSKSTDATLARIARMQASWAPAKQVMQEGMERRGDSFVRQVEATKQALARISGMKAFTATSSMGAHHDMKPDRATTEEDAHKVFDAWSTQQEVTMSNIIHVSVSHTIYPVTEDVLRQVFELYGYVVTTMAVFQGQGWVEASVQLQSGLEAVRAREALHGRNIYDGCCNISIKCTPVAASSTTRAPSLAMEPNVTLTTSNIVAAPTSFTAAMGTPAARLADQMLTNVGGLSVFNESALDTHQEHDIIRDTTIPKEEGKLQHFLSKEMQQHGTNRDTRDLLWDPGKQEAAMKGLFGLRPHAETCVGQCNSCINRRSKTDAKAMQLATDHFLNKMPSWRRNGFSPGYYLQPHLGITPSSSRECILNVAKAAVRIMLSLTLGDVFCLIWKIFKMAVNSQYTFQLYGHLLPWYRCSIFVPLESTSLHMFSGFIFFCLSVFEGGAGDVSISSYIPS